MVMHEIQEKYAFFYIFTHSFPFTYLSFVYKYTFLRDQDHSYKANLDIPTHSHMKYCVTAAVIFKVHVVLVYFQKIS